MILYVDCAHDQHMTCVKWWHPEYVCQCPCHDLIDEVLEALEGEGVDVETCDDDVIERALVAALEAP